MRFSFEELKAAWSIVRKGGKSAGVDGVTVSQFTPHAEEALYDLLRVLRTWEYIPTTYRTVFIPKDNHRWRTIQIATVQDRIVQRVLLNRIQPIIEQCSLASSFAYRPHIGVQNAFLAICAAREAGFDYIFETDIKDCFDTISFDLVKEACLKIGLNSDLIELIIRCISAESTLPSSFSVYRGLPQGAILSPALCNLVLTQFDQAMDRPHRRLIRYADDLLVMCRSSRASEMAHQEVEKAVAELGLKLNQRKTGYADFENGFQFLGAQMIGSFIVQKSPAPYTRNMPKATAKKRTRKLEFIF